MTYFILFSLLSIVFLPRLRAERPLVGGRMVARSDSPSIRKITEIARDRVSGNEATVTVKICHVKTQRVSGVFYDISMIIKTIGVFDDSSNRLCKFTAYGKPWEDFPRINYPSCDKNQKDCPSEKSE